MERMDGGNIRRKNNFSALRLFFACLVVFSHAPLILSGDAGSEPHLGSMSWGAVAVDGFFLLSGFLISKSWVESKSNARYFIKRAARIYPGFLISAFVCVF